MKKIDTVRALRDAEYRSSLTEAERALLPAHPAGLSNISDSALKSVVGGCGGAHTNVFTSCVQPGQECP